MTTEEAVIQVAGLLRSDWSDHLLGVEKEAIRTVLAALDEQTKRLEDSFVRELDAQVDAAAMREALTRARAFVDRWPLSEVCDAALASTGGTALLERVKRLEAVVEAVKWTWPLGNRPMPVKIAAAIARLDEMKEGATT